MSIIRKSRNLFRNFFAPLTMSFNDKQDPERNVRKVGQLTKEIARSAAGSLRLGLRRRYSALLCTCW